MIFNGLLIGSKITLRAVTMEDCTDTYLSWLENPEINKYLETRWAKQTLEGIRAFVSEIRNSSHSFLFAIISNEDHFGKETHIGNIKIGPIHPHYLYADVSYFIGESECWGKGIATEAITLVVDFAFNQLNLHRVQAGAFGSNKGSVKALTKVGFLQEGCFRKQLLTEGSWDDHLFFGLLRDEYIDKETN